jgi:aryl-alcohol dehydrogenase-like predicted oxidoreductase
VGALQQLTQAGKVRAIGVCNCTADHLTAYGPIDSDQERYSLLDRNIERSGVLPWCRENDVAVLAYSPLANGLLTGKIRADRQYGPGDLRKTNTRFRPENVERINATLASLQPIADRHGATIAQLVIAWTIAQPGLTCALCGARDVRQAIENAAAADIELSEEEVRTIGATVEG